MTTEIRPAEAKKNNLIAPLALMVGVVALALSAFTYFTATLNQTGSQLQELETSVTTISQDNAGRIQALQKQIAQLKTNIPLSAEKTLAEVSFLTTVANTQLTVDYDANAALLTLKKAQTLLAASNDARFMSLSSAIQSDREVLQKISAVNQSQLFSDISTVIQKIQALSTLPQTQAVTINTTVPVQDASKPWYQKLLDVLSQLKGLVIIRHVSENNPPLVAPSMEVYLKQNIITQLVMAQWALLHHNERVYQSALQNAQDWTVRYFALTTERDAVTTMFTQLLVSSVTPSLPALSNTMAALSQVNLEPAQSVGSVKTPDVAPEVKAPASTTPNDKLKVTPEKSQEKPSNPSPTSVET